MKQRYERYHDRGFEIVSINVDDDRHDLEEFLKENPVPWITLYDGPWRESPNATYYGVPGLPDMILVDKDGKVLTNGWEGKEWRAKLAELYGDKDDEEKSDDDSKTEASETDTSAADSDKPAADSDKPTADDAKASEAEAGKGK